MPATRYLFQSIVLLLFACSLLATGFGKKSKSDLALGVGCLLAVAGGLTCIAGIQIASVCLAVPAVALKLWSARNTAELTPDARAEVRELRNSPGARRLVRAIVLTDAGDEFATGKALHDVYALGLADINRLTQLTPRLLRRFVSRAEADYVKEKLEAVGASVEIR